MLDHLEAHDRVEAAGGQWDSVQIGAQKRGVLA